MPDEFRIPSFAIPFRQPDYRCHCNRIYLREACAEGVWHLCPCGAWFLFMKRPEEARVDRLAGALGGRVTKARR